MISVGQHAPLFILPDQNGKEQSISDYLGSWVLLYFYPKDDTPGCTKEACGIRDNFGAFKKKGIVVLGVSADSSKSHTKFALKYSLPFILLADENKEVANLYGVWAKKKFMGKEYMGILRNSYLIDPQGMIKKMYEGVKPGEHAMDVLQDVDNFSK